MTVFSDRNVRNNLSHVQGFGVNGTMDSDIVWQLTMIMWSDDQNHIEMLCNTMMLRNKNQIKRE